MFGCTLPRITNVARLENKFNTMKTFRGKKNRDIRKLIWNKGVTHEQVATELGVNRTTFTKWLADDLPEWRKTEIADAIERLGNGRFK